MIEKGEGNFIWFDRVLKTFLPLGIVLTFINFLFTKSQLNTEIVKVYSIKIIIILLIGYLEGKLEWNFFQKIFGPSVNILSDLRKKYVINTGVLTFGLPLGIINFRVFNESFMFEYVRLSIWLIIGVLFGVILWQKNKKIFEQIIND
jgi:predicted permease